MKTNNETDFITVKEMQDLLSIGKSKAYSLLSEEPSIEAVRIGRCIRVNRQSLFNWLGKHPYMEDN